VDIIINFLEERGIIWKKYLYYLKLEKEGFTL
jgi:hypothetical protein